jgi:hypothetical protein
MSLETRDHVRLNTLCPGSLIDYSLVFQTKKTVVNSSDAEFDFEWEQNLKTVMDNLIQCLVFNPATNEVFVTFETEVYCYKNLKFCV